MAADSQSTARPMPNGDRCEPPAGTKRGTWHVLWTDGIAGLTSPRGEWYKWTGKNWAGDFYARVSPEMAARRLGFRYLYPVDDSVRWNGTRRDLQ